MYCYVRVLPPYNTKSRGDHTTGSGYYMFIESSYPRQPGDVAAFHSPWMKTKQGSYKVMLPMSKEVFTLYFSCLVPFIIIHTEEKPKGI